LTTSYNKAKQKIKTIKLKTMRKMILAIAVTLTLGMTSAFANGGDEVNKQIAESFNRDFVTAKNVSWESQKDFVKATFNLNNQVLFAYYKENGELLAVVRNMLSDRLPIFLLTDLKKHYSNYWVSDLFEMASQDQTSYYISLESSDETLVLRADGYNGWSVYKRSRKEVM
jgi:hypothetical protein